MIITTMITAVAPMILIFSLLQDFSPGSTVLFVLLAHGCGIKMEFLSYDCTLRGVASCFGRALGPVLIPCFFFLRHVFLFLHTNSISRKG